MSNRPISLHTALASFDALWSPRIVTRVNDYDVRIAKVEGAHIWHVHDDTDEFFLVLDGELHLSLRESDGERTVRLPQGSAFTVPRGTEHKPYAPSGAAILMFEPTGTPTVGDRHDEIPDHVDATTGHGLTAPVADPDPFTTGSEHECSPTCTPVRGRSGQRAPGRQSATGAPPQGNSCAVHGSS